MDLGGLEALLYSTHLMLSAITKIPELALTNSEANELAKATANVARHYDMQASAKALDWANLAQVCAITYGTRAFAAMQRIKEERKAKAQKTPIVPGAPLGATN